MWVKTTCCNHLYLLFKLETSFYNFCIIAVLYQYGGFYLQKATTFSRSPASPGRELQPPQLLYQLMYQYVGVDLQKATTFSFFQGPRFINFQTGSMNINQSSSISASNNLLFPISTKSSKHFSDICTQNTVTVTTHQILNPEYCSNRQRQLDHNLKIYATSTT